MISARASSTTDRVLENGALNTEIPACAAASRSIWFVPMQNAPIACRCGAFSTTRLVMWVLERIPTRSAPCRASMRSSSSSAPLWVVTSAPVASSDSFPKGGIFSRSSALVTPFIVHLQAECFKRGSLGEHRPDASVTGREALGKAGLRDDDESLGAPCHRYVEVSGSRALGLDSPRFHEDHAVEFEPLGASGVED